MSAGFGALVAVGVSLFDESSPSIAPDGTLVCGWVVAVLGVLVAPCAIALTANACSGEGSNARVKLALRRSSGRASMESTVTAK